MKRAIAMADNCIDVYYKLDRYYLTGNSIDFALNYRDLGGDVTEMTILGNDVFAMALEERLKERGIALRVLKRADRPTGMATMDIVDGDKKHLHFEGNAMEEIELSGEDLEFVKSFDIVYAERWSRIDPVSYTHLDVYKRQEVLDAKELGLSTIDASVVDYFNHSLFNNVYPIYNHALAEKREHPLVTRRYMWKVEY